MADNLSLDKIYQPIRDDLSRVGERLMTLGRVDSPLLAELLDYCLQNGGKRLGRRWCYWPADSIIITLNT